MKILRACRTCVGHVAQPAKTTLFAGGNEAAVRKTAAGRFSNKLASLVLVVPLLAGCISSSSTPPPEKTTVVVPQDSNATVVCQDGTKPPCN
jgi:hypothetical protein